MPKQETLNELCRAEHAKEAYAKIDDPKYKVEYRNA